MKNMRKTQPEMIILVPSQTVREEYPFALVAESGIKNCQIDRKIPWQNRSGNRNDYNFRTLLAGKVEIVPFESVEKFMPEDERSMGHQNRFVGDDATIYRCSNIANLHIAKEYGAWDCRSRDLSEDGEDGED